MWHVQLHWCQSEILKDWSMFLLATFNMMLSTGEEGWIPNAVGWFGKYWMRLEEDILPADATG